MRKTLLLADDSVTMQKVVGITFANEDIDLVTVDSGDAALTRAREVRPDVVLADVGMPGLNGYELCAALKAEPDLAHVRVVLLTGTFDNYDEDRARQVGADAHVSKPFEAQALVDQVHTLLRAAPVSGMPPRSSPTQTSRIAPAPQASAATMPSEPATPGRSIAGQAPTQAANPAMSRPKPPAPAPPPPRPAPTPMDTPALDFDPFSDEPDDPQDDLSAMDTGLEDLPRPTRPGAPPDDGTDLFDDGQKTTFLDPSQELEPARAVDLPDDMQTTLMPPSSQQDLFAEPLDDMQTTLMSSDDLVGPSPAEAQMRTTLMPPPDPNEFKPPAEAKTTLMPPGGQPDLFGRPEPPVSAGPAGTPDFDSSGVFGDAAEGGLLADASLEELPEEPASPPRARSQAWDAPGPDLGGGFDPLDAEDPFPPSAELVQDDEEEELELPADAMAWDETHEGDEPATPNYLDDPSEDPFAAPAPEAPLMAAPPTPPQPQAPPRPAARPSSSPSVPLDPAAMRQALEKVAWEAFGPLSEQIVREVVKKVEAIAWETLPQIAERLVQEEIARLRGDDDDS